MKNLPYHMKCNDLSHGICQYQYNVQYDDIKKKYHG